ncbi:MAG: hypothetical protein FWC16_01250 [Defluviitaleaceae bacterium]|nr:hypothetical protein [Defluviitaleaceae bacterium]MCL2273530.1 hypothetical protein [Defluviitaleaceae bacterium]
MSANNKFETFIFTNDEKKACLPTAIRVVELAQSVVRTGILGLIDETALDNDFIKMAANLMANGYSPDFVEENLYQHIHSGGYNSVALLERILITKGMLMFYSFEVTPEKVAWYLSSLLGEQYVRPLLSSISYSPPNFYDVVEKCIVPNKESIKFEYEMYKLSRLELSYLFLKTNPLILAHAFMGCNRDFVINMKRYLPAPYEDSLCRAMNELFPIDEVDSIFACQKEILDDIDEMKNWE